MSISIKEFETDAFFTSRTCTEVLDFLKKNKDKAFTSAEIAQGLGRKGVANVSTALKKLKKGGFIVRNPPYISLSSRISEEKLKQLKEEEDERMANRKTPVINPDAGRPGRKLGWRKPVEEEPAEEESVKEPIIGQEIDEAIVGEQIKEPIPINNNIKEEETKNVPEKVPEDVPEEEEFPEDSEDEEGPELAKDYQ